MKALGKSVAELFEPTSGDGVPHRNGKPSNGGSKVYTLAHIQRRPQVAAIYHYGADLLKVRIEEHSKAKSFAWYRATGHDGDQWIPGTAGAVKPLYREDAVREAVEKGRAVFILEGEKDVDTALALGLVATTSPDGASRDAARSKFPAHLAEPLRGAKRVVVIADNDEAGRAHARATLEVLLPVVEEAKLIETLPGVLEHGDLTDWVHAGGTRKELEELVGKAPTFRQALPSVPPQKPQELWEAPRPLDTHNLPTFPVEVLPVWARDYVSALSVSLQVPIDAPAMMFLAVASTATAGRYAIRLAADWVEPTNFWGLTVQPVGERKSATLSKMAAPLSAWEQRQAESMLEAVEEAIERRKILEKRLSLERETASKSGSKEDTDRVLELGRQLRSTHVPTIPRLWASDATPEAIVRLLREQGGNLAILSSEAEFFGQAGGRYSQGVSNLDAILKAHSGDPIRVDRVGRQPEYVPNPALTLGLAVQPEILSGLTRNPEFRGRGLLARFLYSLPPSRVGEREIDTPAVPPSATAAYVDGVTCMLDLLPGTDEAGHACPHELELSRDGGECFRQFRRMLEPRLAPGADLSSLADWGSKLAGMVGRLSAILHVAEYAPTVERPQFKTVSDHSVEAAAAIALYGIEHARACYASMGADPVTDEAKHILNWVRRNNISTFTVRDAFNVLKSRFQKVQAMLPGLAALVDHGYLRQRQAVCRQGPGRKQSPLYEVNPALFNPGVTP
jgi:hypothetical protein